MELKFSTIVDLPGIYKCAKFEVGAVNTFRDIAFCSIEIPYVTQIVFWNIPNIKITKFLH